MSQKRFRRVLVQMLAIVTALMMVLCMSAFAEDGEVTEDDIAAVDETAGDVEDTDAIDEGEPEDTDLGDEEGFDELSDDEVLEDDEVVPEDDGYFEEEGDVEDEGELADDGEVADEGEVEEEPSEEEELEPQTAEEEEPTVVTVVKRVPSTGDFNASVLPLMAGFAAVGAAVVVLRRRATK